MSTNLDETSWQKNFLEMTSHLLSDIKPLTDVAKGFICRIPRRAPPSAPDLHLIPESTLLLSLNLPIEYLCISFTT